MISGMQNLYSSQLKFTVFIYTCVTVYCYNMKQLLANNLCSIMQQHNVYVHNHWSFLSNSAYTVY